MVRIAVFSDFAPLHEIHHEIRPARLGDSAVEDLGDVRVIHYCQCLPLGFKTGHDFFGVHPKLNDF